jgi:hypothetical protein
MRHVVRRRIEPTLPCTYLAPNSKQPESCGAMIPHHPTKPCPNCGRKQIRPTAPAPKPGDLIIDDNALLIDEALNEVVAVHVTGFTRLASAIAQSLRHIEWMGNMHTKGQEGRLSGVVVAHRTFGFTQPSPLRRRWGCGRSSFDSAYPEAATLAYEFAAEAEQVMRRWAPEPYERSATAVAATIPEAWRIEGTPWTSGIINNTAALPYHCDSGNIRGSWSAMLGARHGLDGGLLHLLDYDVYLAIPHGSISIFDGQSVLHGVTPLKRTHHDAWRYTLVTYSKSGLKVCCPDPAGEAKRAQLKATDMEQRRADRRQPKAPT